MLLPGMQTLKTRILFCDANFPPFPLFLCHFPIFRGLLKACFAPTILCSKSLFLTTFAWNFSHFQFDTYALGVLVYDICKHLAVRGVSC